MDPAVGHVRHLRARKLLIPCDANRIADAFDMITNFLPVRAFLTRADADVALRLIESSGIYGKITSELGGDLPFMLLVAPDKHEKAVGMLRQNDPPTPLCERCGRKVATVHLTMIVDGCSTAANFCRGCYEIPRE
jgi:hypothetical protein